MKNSVLVLTLFTMINLQNVFASQEQTKGLLPEVRINNENEDQNQDKAFKSEVMITKAENNAIQSLIKIIAKKKGSSDEPDLLFRLAELYMRRAKSGRFFDLSGSEGKLKIIGIENQKAQEALKNAISVYNKIQSQYPKFKSLDAVYFNNAFAHLQTRQTEKAKELYEQLISQFPKAIFISDALLEVGEIYYNQQNFTIALSKFKAIEAYPQSRAYPYGLYKSAWCHYNLKQTDLGVQQLLTVVRQNPSDSQDEKKYNLRKEALRDLALFVGETQPADEIFPFFEKITTETELGEVIMAIAGLYESHSRHKEIVPFVKQFVDKYPSNPISIKGYARLIDINETMKKRDQVISYLQKMADYCKTQPIIEDPNAEKNEKDKSCSEQFRSISLEISKKWWDIWLKNKKNVEFSKLTEQAFEILLSNDSNNEKPDSKSRYAYAELLFQQGKFDLASQNYEEVADHKSIDKTLAHDALYGSIFSLEKSLDKKDDTVFTEKQKMLSERYVKEYPNGEHIVPIQYKLGFIAYKQNDHETAIKYLTPLTKKAKYEDIKNKSEDIILDIFNQKKDYKSIQAFAKETSKNTTNDKRKSTLNKLVEESHYSQLQIDSEKLPTIKRIEQLNAFAKEHSTSKLGQESFWQAISLAYSQNLPVIGADLSLEYIKQYPEDKRKLDAVKDAVKSYIDAGYLAKSISTLRELARLDQVNSTKHFELSCDLLRVNHQFAEARGCYRGLFDQADKIKKNDLLSKIMRSFKSGQSTTELESIQNQILKENIEPYSTQILIDQANKLLASGKDKDAFNLSLKINSRPVDADLRAEARLIQAQVLEKEFISQSVKAKENKFAVVLSLKTEKMDKAHTAYSTTVKMSKSEKVQLMALQGIDRIYNHFIESVSNMPIPESLTAEEQKGLREELIKMTLPFKDKVASNLSQIRKLSKLATGESEDINWAETNPEKTVEPRLKFPSAKMLSHYLPSRFDITENGFSRLPASEKKCEPNNPSAQSLGGCILTKKYSEAEQLAFKLTSSPENRAMGLYYLSVIADRLDQPDKALWMIEKSLALDSENSLLNYQKGKVLYSVEGVNSALPFFEKVLDMKKHSSDLVVMSALKSFSDRDYITATEEFSRLSNEELYNYGVAVIYVEAMAQKGEAEQALKIAGRFLNLKPDYVDMMIEQGRIFEQFAMNNEGAMGVYKKALARSNKADQKDWLQKKVDFLKLNKNNQISLNVSSK